MQEFYKYHGAGNDFILIDNMNGQTALSQEQVVLLCDRHKGVGADGVIFLEKSSKADCFMNYCNSDGSFVEMCGNGIRCLAKFFLEQIKSQENKVKELSIDTRAGIKKIVCNDDGSFSVNMGAPVFSHTDFPDGSLTLENFSFNFVSMGNPHAVSLVKNIFEIDLPKVGPKIENDSHFPNKINVELVEKVRDDYFKVKVWERGSGATLSCGTGACAAYACVRQPARNASRSEAGGDLAEIAEREITLEFPGGKLYLSQNEKGEIILRGPAEFVFKGEIK